MARDPADARHQPMLLRPRFRLADAPADVLAQLQAGARAEGHRTWADRWRCRACAAVWPWQDLLAGEVEGTAVWLPLCPTADCAGIGWLYFEGI
jgi:hypothetical protein